MDLTLEHELSCSCQLAVEVRYMYPTHILSAALSAMISMIRIVMLLSSVIMIMVSDSWQYS